MAPDGLLMSLTSEVVLRSSRDLTTYDSEHDALVVVVVVVVSRRLVVINIRGEGRGHVFE